LSKSKWQSLTKNKVILGGCAGGDLTLFPDNNNHQKRFGQNHNLAKDYRNIHKKYFSKGHRPNSCLFNLGLTPLLKLILIIKDCCFRMIYVILTLPSKTFPCIHLLEYAHSLLWQTIPL
jgi:hypothetical protein